MVVAGISVIDLVLHEQEQIHHGSVIGSSVLVVIGVYFVSSNGERAIPEHFVLDEETGHVGSGTQSGGCEEIKRASLYGSVSMTIFLSISFISFMRKSSYWNLDATPNRRVVLVRRCFF